MIDHRARVLFPLDPLSLQYRIKCPVFAYESNHLWHRDTSKRNDENKLEKEVKRVSFNNFGGWGGGGLNLV